MKKIIMSLVVMFVCLLAVPATKADAATVKLNKTAVSVYEHKTTTLKVYNTKKKITWKSQNTKIATVKNGVITGKKKGTTKITAKVNGKTYTCKVTVKSAAISASKLTLTVGQTKQISINGAYKKVTYKSSNTKVVTVKNGKLKAVKQGTATITLTHNGKKFTCKITVKAEKVITVKLDKNLFYDKAVNKELYKKLKIKSKKNSGKYVEIKVTKASYDKLMNEGKKEIEKSTKTFVKKSASVTKATYANDYRTMNLYIKVSKVTSTSSGMDKSSLETLMANLLTYQCLRGTLLDNFNLKINYYDSTTKKLLYTINTRD